MYVLYKHQCRNLYLQITVCHYCIILQNLLNFKISNFQHYKNIKHLRSILIQYAI